jgi:biopolymer transport protein ExbD
MTPMVDVVMVILVFLMLAGSFAGAEHYLVSNQVFNPKGGGGQAPPPGFVPEQPLEIKIDSPLPDRFVARVEAFQVDDPQRLTAALQQMRDRLEKAGNPPDKVSVILSPSKSVKYKFLIDVYQSALQAGFTKVSFAPAR